MIRPSCRIRRRASSTGSSPKAAIAAWVVVGALVANVVLRLVAHDALWIGIVLDTFTPYVYLPAYGALSIAAWLQRPRLAFVTGIVIVAHLVWTFGPLTRKENLTETQRHLRIATANVAYWNAGTDGIVTELLASDADVIAVQELAPKWAEAFASERFVRVYPHRIERVGVGDGSGIYSRVPLLEKDILDTPLIPIARVTVNVDGAPVRIYSVHAPAPSRAPLVKNWQRALEAVLAAAKSESLPVVIAGDFNTTQHSGWYARLRAEHFRGSHDACGRPLATTWPNGTRIYPPVRLDHVLLPPALTCVGVAEGIGSGSDHRPVIVDVRARRPD